MSARIFVFMPADVFDRIISSVLFPWNFRQAFLPDASRRGILPEIIIRYINTEKKKNGSDELSSRCFSSHKLLVILGSLTGLA